jgi:phenylacetate-coenzyme A ligase PaaK-like adenylate-forming protein
MRHTSYYRDRFARHGIDLATIQHADIASVPITTKVAVRAQPDAFVRQCATPFLRATTTGTTGAPTSISFSAHELRVYALLAAISTSFTHDLVEGDVVQISTCARGVLGNLCLAGACAHVGAQVHLAGQIDPMLALAQIRERRSSAGKRTRPNVLFIHPSSLGELVTVGLAHQYQPADSGLERIILGGEMVTQGLKQRCEEVFGPVRILEGYGMTETWPVDGRLCEAGHLHFEVSRGLVEVHSLESDRKAEVGEYGTLVVTPFPPYRETTLLLRYDTEDVVQALPDDLSCSLRHLPATSHLLGKRRLAVQHERGWTFPRQVAEALEAIPALPLPARYGFWAVPGGVAVEVQCDTATPHLCQQVTASLEAWGVPVQTVLLRERGQPLQHPVPLRCDLREQQFADLVSDALPAPVPSDWR